MRRIPYRKVAALLALALLLMAISGCGILPEEAEPLAPPLVAPKKPVYELFEVKRGDIKRTVKGVGNAQSMTEEPLFFSAESGRLRSIDVKSGANVVKGDILVQLETGDLVSRIAMQRNNLEKTRLTYDNARKSSSDWEAIRMAELDVFNSEIVLADLERQYAESIIVAPFDGVITFIENFKAGDSIPPYKTIIVISDPKDLCLYYQSATAKEVKLGMQAEMTFEGTKFTGEVTQCPDSVPLDALEMYKNAILVKFDSIPQNLKYGNLIDFTITVSERKDTMVVPKRGVKTFMTRSYVIVMEDERKREIDVEVGVQNDFDTEIVSGLQEGQMIILD